MTRPIPRLHAVTDDRILSHPNLIDRARALAGTGPIALHVRGRALAAKRLTELAFELMETGAAVFVNDRADIAEIVGAAGVHAPADGLPSAAIRRVVRGEMLVGRSAHGPQEARAATEHGADYVFLGPIWPTRSHPRSDSLGPAAIAAAQPARIIAIGGVTPERVPICRRSGAYGVAAISALWDAPDPAGAAAAMLLSLGRT